MSIHIRPFNHSDQDYRTAVMIENRVWPDYPTTVEEQRQTHTTRGATLFYQRYMLELDRKVVATGVVEEADEVDVVGKFYIHLNVLPEFRGRGAAVAFYDHALAVVREQGGGLLKVNTREDQTAALDFLAKRDFLVVMRYPVYHLDLTHFEPVKFMGQLTAVRDHGIEICSVAELQQRDPNWEQRLWELGELEVMQDIPALHPYAPKSFHSFRTSFLQNPNFWPQATFVALDGRRYVGLSTLWVPLTQMDRLYTGLTGVVRSHRRRGIATALNIRALIFAKQLGARVVETDVSTAVIDPINTHLGFTPQPAWLDLEKSL